MDVTEVVSVPVTLIVAVRVVLREERTGLEVGLSFGDLVYEKGTVRYEGAPLIAGRDGRVRMEIKRGGELLGLTDPITVTVGEEVVVEPVEAGLSC